MKKKIFSLLALVMAAMTASARIAEYKLESGTSEHGRIIFTVGGDSRNYADEGDEVTVTIEPEPGWSIGSVKGQWYASMARAPRLGDRSVDPQDNIDLLNDIDLSPVSGQTNQWTFTMQRANAEISVNYLKLLTHTDITISDIWTVTYNGQPIEPTVTVKDGSSVLTPGTHYTVAYTNNINVGKATVTITAVEGSGYSGTVTTTFAIKANKIALGDAIVGAEEYYEDIKNSNPEAAAALKDAIDDAYVVWRNADATQPQTNNATRTLNAAVNAARADVALKRVTVVIPAKGYLARVDGDKRQIEAAVEGVSLYSVKSVNSREVELTDALNVVAAGMPYLICNTGNEDVPVSIVVSSSEADKVTYDSEHFKGTLEDKAFTAADLQTTDYYVLSNGKDFVWVKDAGTLAAGNCWIELPASAAHARALGIVGEDGLSGIGTVKAAAEKGGNWYDLQGRRVAEPARGLYVRDGRKVVVK